MRKLISAALLAVLVAMPVAAAPIDVDHGPSVTTRVLGVVASWLAKLGAGFDSIGSKSDPDDDDRDPPPPFEGLGAGPDPWG